ncbi:MAG: hypothetical protein ACJ77K_19340 [Bacteroidia bacterium]
MIEKLFLIIALTGFISCNPSTKHGIEGNKFIVEPGQETFLRSLEFVDKDFVITEDALQGGKEKFAYLIKDGFIAITGAELSFYIDSENEISLIAEGCPRIRFKKE